MILEFFYDYNDSILCFFNLTYSILHLVENLESLKSLNLVLVKFTLRYIYRPPNRDINYMQSICKLIEYVCCKYENAVMWITVILTCGM